MTSKTAFAVVPRPSCAPVRDEDDGEFIGFACHVGANTPELIRWRLGERPPNKETTMTAQTEQGRTIEKQVEWLENSLLAAQAQQQRTRDAGAALATEVRRFWSNPAREQAAFDALYAAYGAFMAEDSGNFGGPTTG